MTDMTPTPDMTAKNSCSAAEWFYAYRPDGTRVQIVTRNKWEKPREGLRQERENFCLRHGFIVPTTSCAVSCIMAAFNRKEYCDD